MIDVFQVAQALVAHVQNAYAQDVAIVAYYGSYATGTAKAESDLDMYYIPEDGKAGSLYRSFVVAGVPFEFWPISWAFAEKIASGRHRWSIAPSILMNARVLYSRTEADMARFDLLRTQIASLQKPENKAVVVARAWEVFQTAPFYLETLRLACACQDVLGTRWMGTRLVNVLLDCLALVNQTCLERDWTSDIEPLRRLSRKPEQMLEAIEVIMTSGKVGQIQQAAEDLLRATREILVRERYENQKPVALIEVLDGYYAAIQEYVSKINAACEQQNIIKASYWTTQMQSELARMLAQANTQAGVSEVNFYSEYGADWDSLGWPNLAQAIESRDFGYIAGQAQDVAKKARDFLTAHTVPMNVFETLEDALAYISGK